jgi:hypothetical protein
MMKRLHFIFSWFIICLMLLGLTRRSFAVSCSETTNINNSYHCKDVLIADFDAAAGEVRWEFYVCPQGFICNVCFGIPAGARFWQKNLSSTVRNIFWLEDGWVDVCGGGPCAEERATLEQQCGGPDSYDFDETWCTGRCKNACREKARAACHDKPMSGSSNGPYDPMSNTKWWEDGSGMCKYECKCPNYDGSVPYN